MSDLSSRLTPLFDGRPGLRCAMSVQVREPAADPSIQQSINPPILDFVSSDPTLDRYHEIISPAGWQLATYQKNPVFQNAHQYGDIIFTLGRALTTEIRSVADRQVLFQRIEFAVDANPMAKIAYALYAGKFLSAVSVGFIPLRWQEADGTEHQVERTAALPLPSGEGRGEGDSLHNSTTPSLRSARPRRRYLEQELLEVSAVAIPANPNALALAYKSGALEKCDLKETAALLTDLATSHRHAPAGSPLSSPWPPARAEGRGEGELSSIQHPVSRLRPTCPTSPTSPTLLDLTREIRSLLAHL